MNVNKVTADFIDDINDAFTRISGEKLLKPTTNYGDGDGTPDYSELALPSNTNKTSASLLIYLESLIHLALVIGITISLS